jgi:hypothetical protein
MFGNRLKVDLNSGGKVEARTCLTHLARGASIDPPIDMPVHMSAAQNDDFMFGGRPTALR